jgi:P4 family phage/plasmid primase-like protien
MYEDLAHELGVEVEAIKRLGLGYDYQYQAWVTPERNVLGDIIGLSYRYADGAKTMAPTKTLPGRLKKNRRGLVYPFNQKYDTGTKRYSPGRHNWERVGDVGVRCPVCDKPDWCLVSAENPDSPQAVLCQRVEEGSVKETDGGYLHIRKNSGRLTAADKLVLPPSDFPLIIVEGATDVLAALSLGFIAIGRPNCGASGGLLGRMPLAGREIFVIGENDAGAGEKGMKETFAIVHKLAANTKMFLPPEGVKDLRAWYNTGVTFEELLEYAAEHGDDKTDGGIVFADCQPTTLADAFTKEHSVEDHPTWVSYKGKRYKWTGCMYAEIDSDEQDRHILDFMVGKRMTVETLTGTVVKPVPTNSRWTKDVSFCLKRSLPLAYTEGWLTQLDLPDKDQLISFPNGVLDVGEYLESGKIKMYNSSPDLFVLGAFPYAFDPNSESGDFENFLLNTQEGDVDTVHLLQQWAGYVLLPDMTMEKFVLLQGKARAGKGTIIETFKEMIGGDLCSSLTMASFTTEFGRAGMIGKLLGVFGDAKPPRANEAATALGCILAITGGDGINVNRKYLNELSNIYLKIRFIMSMNELPSFSDDSLALASRALPVPFTVSYVGHEDYSLKPRIVQEARDGKLINWALRGLKDLRDEGRFVIPKRCQLLLDELRDASSNVRVFLEEMCDTGPKAHCFKTQFYDLWKEWNDYQGLRGCSQNSLCRKLTTAIPNFRTGRRRDKKGKLEYTYEGVAPKPDMLTEFGVS